MAGLNIPIGGDLAPFLAVASELKREMGRMGATVRAAMRKTGGEAKGAAVGFKILKSAGVMAIRAIAGSVRGLMRMLSGLGNKLKNLIPGGGMLGPMIGIASVAGAIALLVSQISGAAQVAGGIEKTSIALEALTGSGDEAKRILDEMRATWMRTGATIEDQSGSIRKFIALGFSPDDALKLQRNLLDVAGAVGLTADQSTLLASALAQVKAKGIVSMEELRQQIAEKGIPVFEALAAKMNVTKGALIKMVSDGKVPAEALLDIFLNMEGAFGKFVGGANRMGMTFLGLISRLKGAWQLLMAEFATPIVDSIKPILNRAIDLIDSFKEKARAAGKVVGDALLAAFAMIQSGRVGELLEVGLRVAFTSAVDTLMRGLRSAMAFLGAVVKGIFDYISDRLGDPMFMEGVKSIFRGLGDLLGIAIQKGIADLEESMGKVGAAGQRRKLINKDQERADQNFFMGSQAIANSSGSFSDAMAKAMIEGSAAAYKEAKAPISEKMKQALDDYKKIIADMREGMAKLKQEVAMPDAPNVTAPTPLTEAPAQAAKGILGTLTTSLGRVGGGGFGMTFTPIVTEQKKTNVLLNKLVVNTTGSKSLTPVIQ